MRCLIALAATAIAAVPAQAAPLPCLDAATTRAASDVLLAPAMTAVADRCGREFAGAAPMIAAQRGDLAGRFADRAEEAWPVLREWVLGTGAPELAEARRQLAQSDGIARAFLSALVVDGLSRRLDARGCAAVDTMLGAVLPLSDDQIGAIANAALRVALADTRATALGVRVCSAAGAR